MRKSLKMKKETLYLIVIATLAILLSACQTQATPTAAEALPTQTLDPIGEAATATPITEPTATNTLEPSATPTVEPTAKVPPTETTEPAPTEPPAPAQGSTRIWDADQMEQVYVPAGEFIMGSSDIEAKITIEGGRAYPEIPVHTVYLDGYWIDKYEVTTSQYALCVEAGGCRAPYLSSSETRPKYYGNPEYADYPVIWVSWFMSNEYCQWAGRRLPTEAEWEKASRGTEGAKYPWGNDEVSGERANFCDINCERTIANGKFDDGYGDTAPIGSYPAGVSPYGALDMSGNVWEWTSTLIQDYPYDATDGRENQDVWGERVWRGGPWSNGYWWLRSSVRYRSVPSYWYVNLGFRCASSE
jgi:formylglycine-generating enzyme required for sulfatase activity